MSFLKIRPATVAVCMNECGGFMFKYNGERLGHLNHLKLLNYCDSKLEAGLNG